MAGTILQAMGAVACWRVGAICLALVSLVTAGGCGKKKSGGMGAVVTMVGPAGGEVSTASGQLTLTVPAGALSGETMLTVRQVEQPPAGAVGPVFELGPDGTTFSVPVTISLTIPASSEELQIATLQGGLWVAAGPTMRDEASGRLSTLTTHLSVYGAVRPTECYCPVEPERTCCEQARGTFTSGPIVMEGRADWCFCNQTVSAGETSRRPSWEIRDCLVAKNAIGPTACTDCLLDCCRQAGGYISMEGPGACNCTIAGVAAASPAAASLGPCWSGCLARSGFSPSMPTVDCRSGAPSPTPTRDAGADTRQDEIIGGGGNPDAPVTGSCQVSADCPRGQQCSDGSCETCPAEPGPCTPGELCTSVTACLARGCGDTDRCMCVDTGNGCAGEWQTCESTEGCNRVDDDCDGQIDEGCVTCTTHAQCPTRQLCDDGLCQPCGQGCSATRTCEDLDQPGAVCVQIANGCTECQQPRQ